MPFASLSDTRSHVNAACGSTALSVLRTRDEAFAHANLSNVVRGVALWTKTMRIDCADIADWDLDVYVVSEVCGASLLIGVTGTHPLALGDHLGIEIDTVYTLGEDGNVVSTLRARVVAIPLDLTYAFDGGARVYDAMGLAYVASDDLAPSVTARARALVRAWAAHM